MGASACVCAMRVWYAESWVWHDYAWLIAVIYTFIHTDQTASNRESWFSILSSHFLLLPLGVEHPALCSEIRMHISIKFLLYPHTHILGTLTRFNGNWLLPDSSKSMIFHFRWQLARFACVSRTPLHFSVHCSVYKISTLFICSSQFNRLFVEPDPEWMGHQTFAMRIASKNKRGMGKVRLLKRSRASQHRTHAKVW